MWTLFRAQDDGSILLLLSQEGRVVFPIGLEGHAIPRGDPFADVGVMILVEIDQIDFFALGDELPENAEPFHSVVTSYNFGCHCANKAVGTGVVQKSMAMLRITDCSQKWNGKSGRIGGSMS